MNEEKGYCLCLLMEDLVLAKKGSLCAVSATDYKNRKEMVVYFVLNKMSILGQTNVPKEKIYKIEKNPADVGELLNSLTANGVSFNVESLENDYKILKKITCY